MRARRVLKRLVERGLVLGAPLRARRGDAPVGAILAYHNVVPDGEPVAGDLSLHMSRARFSEHLERLGERFCVIPLADLVGRNPVEGPVPVAITFDDAYAGAVAACVDEVVARGLSATIFAVAGMIGRHDFWWDALADPGLGAVPAQMRDHALWALAGDDGAIREWAAENGAECRPMPDHATTARAGELEDLARSPGITVASHSWSHANLAALDEPTLTDELARSARDLAARFGDRFLPWISYPYGLSSPLVEDLAASRYALGFRIDGGALRTVAVDRPASVPRINVPAGLSADGLELRIRGVIGGS